MAKILVTDGMAEEGIQTLSSAGHQVDVKKLSQEELIKEISQYDGLVVRSATQVTPDVLEAGAPKLQVVGRAGVGVDNINLDAATQKRRHRHECAARQHSLSGRTYYRDDFRRCPQYPTSTQQA